MRRDSDRWVTPGVVVAGLVVGGAVVLAITAGVVFLAYAGRDPDPVLQLLTQVVAAVSALASLVLQLVGRRTATKTERNTGELTSAVVALGAGRHSAPDETTAGARL